MTWQAVVAFMACARIGAIHSVIFGGFSSESLKDRIDDCKSRVVITSDEGRRGGKTIPIKNLADNAIKNCPHVEHVLVLQRTGNPVNFVEGRDHWWHEETAKVPNYCPPELLSSEDSLFILYVSKTIDDICSVLNFRHRPLALLVNPRASCTLLVASSLARRCRSSTASMFTLRIDLAAWPTLAGSPVTRKYSSILQDGTFSNSRHSYVVYGPLANGIATTVFESTPVYPTPSRFWDTIDRHRITHFYTAPTAVRLLRRLGEEYVQKADLSTLRVIGSVGEPINPEAWHWLNDHVGRKQAAIVDTFFQTETGSIVVSPLPGAIECKPGSATVPFLGIQAALLDPVTGKELEGDNVEGVLVFKNTWPSIARTVWKDHNRWLDVYMRVCTLKIFCLN